MERDLVLHGIRLGEYGYDPETMMKKLKEECIANKMNYVKFSLAGTDFGKEYLVNMAKFLAENKVYFDMSYVHVNELPCGFDEETFEAMKEAAGEYYRANALAEVGTKFGCSAVGYGETHGKPNYGRDMEEAQINFGKTVDTLIEKASFGGRVATYSTEPTSLISYHAGKMTYPTLELVCGNPEIMVPQTRACARAFNKKSWGTYVAHEWYGGTKDLDPLKMKRLRMYYDYAYLSGSNLFVLESGDECLFAHDTHPFNVSEGVVSPYDTIYNREHPMCKEYRRVLADFSKFVNEDVRPVGGPKVKVAFVQGNLDGYSPWRAGSSLWNTYEKQEFGYSTPEFVWRIFDDIHVKRNWADTHNFGEVDLSGAPAYGMYDIVPATAGSKAFSRYDYLIFTGWNTMTEEIYESLKEYVHGGGRLFLCAAHLNTSKKRNGEISLINGGDVSELCGCRLDAENAFVTNDGVKFRESIVPEIRYPTDFNFDPLFSEGYIKYAKAELGRGKDSGILSHHFCDSKTEKRPISLVENKLGNGYCMLMTSLDYPGAAGYTMYRNIVREIITASHRQADIKVYGGDKLRFSVYENNKIYLLNTDFDCRIEAVVDCGARKEKYLLNPGELHVIEAKM